MFPKKNKTFCCFNNCLRNLTLSAKMTTACLTLCGCFNEVVEAGDNTPVIYKLKPGVSIATDQPFPNTHGALIVKDNSAMWWCPLGWVAPSCVQNNPSNIHHDEHIICRNIHGCAYRIDKIERKSQQAVWRSKNKKNKENIQMIAEGKKLQLSHATEDYLQVICVPKSQKNSWINA